MLGRAARAAYRLGRYEQANTLFRDAAALIGDDAALQIAWGELFLDKQNRSEAVRSFRAALQSDRRNAAAFAGLARAFADENSATARELVARALSLNPALVPAFLVLADLALDEDHRDEARTAVEQALAVNPSSLEALSRKAAIALLEDRTADFDALVASVLAINPRYGDVYRIAGAQAARHYRFDAAASLARKALETEPDNVRASADLGVHLLRTGDEAGARTALDTAFRADPYDVVTYNLLGLLDSLERFETVEDGVVTMRLHPDEAPVLREHALPLARRALDTLAARYGHTVDGRVLVEIFPKHDDFAVRNVGLPGMVGALGACFGRVVTLDSPRARPPGTFNWQATLWHEMAHVITLQMSHNRIPRWLTEGISVFEEQRARPEWGREMELRFADALERGEVLPLAELNRGFMSGETIALAYYEASLLVDHLVDDARRAGAAGARAGLRRRRVVDEAMRRGDRADAGRDRAGVPRVGHRALRRRAGRAARPGGRPAHGADAARDDRALAAEYPGNFELQVRLGDQRAAAGEVAGRTRRGSAPRTCCPPRSATTARWHASPISPRSRATRDRAVDCARAPARAGRHQHRGGAASGRRSSIRYASRRVPRGPGTASPSSIRSTPRPRPRSAATRSTPARRTSPRAGSARRWRPAPWTRPPRTAISPRATWPSAKRRRPAAGAGGARGRAVVRPRAGSAADARGRGPVMRRRALLLGRRRRGRAGRRRAARRRARSRKAQPGAHLAGLQWTFVRIKYTAQFRPGSNYRYDYWGEPWAIDAPAAEQNLSRRLKTVTAIEVGDPHGAHARGPAALAVPVDLLRGAGQPRACRKPRCRFCASSCCAAARPPSTTSTGPMSGTIWCGSCSACFPERRIVDLPLTHPIYTCFYKIDAYPQIPGLGSFLSGRMWEKGGFVPHLRAVLDDRDRPMVLINWNTDMGDGWEWSNAEEYPGYIRNTREAYRMGINEIVYALTH